MKITRLSLVAAAVLGGLLACSNLATAQDAPKEGKKGKRGMPTLEERMDRMTKELKLTDEQKPKIEALLKETDKKRQELFADSNVPREDRREKMQTINDAQDKKLKEVLTSEQYTKWEKLREEMRARRPGGPGGEKKAEKKN